MVDNSSPVRRASAKLYDLETSDPDGVLFDRSALTDSTRARINRVMSALAGLRAAEDRLSVASQRYMQLNRTDMRALHYLIGAEHSGEIATPGSIADHLAISTASTTKLLDRLERGRHIERQKHPSDRRAFAITITDETRSAAMSTVGRQQAKRMIAATQLAPEELDTVAEFLENMARDIDVSNAEWTHPEEPESGQRSPQS